MNSDHRIKDSIVTSIYARAEEITDQVIRNPKKTGRDFTERLDRIVTSRLFGMPLMLALLATVFWITIYGANYPSDLLARLLFTLEDYLTVIFFKLNSPVWLHGVLILGMYRGLAWVISVMLPPMAIFFPIFTLLEDFGYLPRIAFNLDHLFQKAGAHGKQALTMSMGFGCNAAGIIAARIIDSPRERLVAILTNNLVPCNGRFPILIVMGTIVAGSIVGLQASGLMASLIVLGAILLGIFATLLVSKALTSTILQGESSTFVLELPPYRRPRVGQVLLRSFLDRTLFVLWRAIVVAAPAGILTWVLANISVNDLTLIAHLSNWLAPMGKAIGLDGVILLAFILGLPANEIVIPIMLMTYLAEGAMLELEGIAAIRELLLLNGWTWLTALNFIIFAIFHWPCGTTLLTIKRETGSWKWTLLSALIPTGIGIFLCFIVTKIATFFF